MYEGRILGSNIGCISSYTLEVLIVFILINHFDEIESPIDLFFKFFEYDWNKYVVTIFGLTKLEDAKENPELITNFSEVLTSEIDLKRSTLLHAHYELLVTHQKQFDQWNEKYGHASGQESNTPLNYFLNIIDPINPSNNLGKSINNFHSKRIKRVFNRQKENLKPLVQIKG